VEDASHCARLVLKGIGAGCISTRFELQDLEGHLPIQVPIDGPVNRSDAPLGQRLEDFKVVDPAAGDELLSAAGTRHPREGLHSAHVHHLPAGGTTFQQGNPVAAGWMGELSSGHEVEREFTRMEKLH
jgi:hypothetical protein